MVLVVLVLVLAVADHCHCCYCMNYVVDFARDSFDNFPVAIAGH